jgi:hypothetical protein
MCAEKVVCPFCSNSVDIYKFGDGWVGTCCHGVCYNSHLQPSIKLTKDIKGKNGFERFVLKTSHKHVKN